MRSVNLAPSVQDSIKRSLEQYRKHILAAGPFGSEEDDFDMLVVFESMTWELFVNFCRSLRKAAPEISFFPTFRLQSLIEGSEEGHQSVHLLAYASPEVFKQQERDFVYYCIVRSFDPWIGERASLQPPGEVRPRPDITYYINLLCETAQIFFMESLDPVTASKEARKKLLYIVKFSLLEAFYHEDSEISLRQIAKTLFTKLPNSLRQRAGHLYRTIECWDNPNPEEVASAFHDVFQLLRDLLNATPEEL